MTRMARTLTLVTIVFALAVAALPAAASGAVGIGLGDQNATTFSDDHFKALGIKRVRVVTPWDVAITAGNSLWLDEYLAAA